MDSSRCWAAGLLARNGPKWTGLCTLDLFCTELRSNKLSCAALLYLLSLWVHASKVSQGIANGPQQRFPARHVTLRQEVWTCLGHRIHKPNPAKFEKTHSIAVTTTAIYKLSDLADEVIHEIESVCVGSVYCSCIVHREKEFWRTLEVSQY